MGRTPQRFPGALSEEEVQFDDRTADGNPTVDGALRRVGDALMFKKSTGVVDLTVGGSGISEAQHENLDSLVHLLAESMYTEVVRSGGQVTDVIIWTDSGKTTKVRETNITRTSGQVSQIVVKQYDGAGTLITGQTLTGTVARSSGQVASIDWVQS